MASPLFYYLLYTAYGIKLHKYRPPYLCIIPSCNIYHLWYYITIKNNTPHTDNMEEKDMYIIKKHYEATEKNDNFAGNVLDWYYGKKGTLLIGGFGQLPSQREVESFGYTSLAGAKRGLRAAQELAASETSRGYWNVTAELLEV